MNREIADSPRWGAKEIRDRGRALAEPALQIWPGPDSNADTTPIETRWWRMSQILACIPAGRWTSYSEVAEVIGSHRMPVGARLGSATVPNGHRVLRFSGEISPDFRWPDPDRADAPRRCSGGRHQVPHKRTSFGRPAPHRGETRRPRRPRRRRSGGPTAAGHLTEPGSTRIAVKASTTGLGASLGANSRPRAQIPPPDPGRRSCPGRRLMLPHVVDLGSSR